MLSPIHMVESLCSCPVDHHHPGYASTVRLTVIRPSSCSVLHLVPPAVAPQSQALNHCGEKWPEYCGPEDLHGLLSSSPVVLLSFSYQPSRPGASPCEGPQTCERSFMLLLKNGPLRADQTFCPVLSRQFSGVSSCFLPCALPSLHPVSMFHCDDRDTVQGRLWLLCWK